MAPCENFSTPTTERTHLIQGEEIVLGNGNNCSLWNGSDKTDLNCSLAVSIDEIPVKLNKFQIIKAVVLAGVTIVIMISICRMVFQLFVRTQPGRLPIRRDTNLKRQNVLSGLTSGSQSFSGSPTFPLRFRHGASTQVLA